MRVLKFGGTSVGSANSIRKVQEIVTQKCPEEKIIVVVSALSGVTNLLIKTAHLAKNGDVLFEDIYTKIISAHKITLDKLTQKDIHVQQVLSLLKPHWKELKTLYKGIYLLKELSPKTLDKIMSFGELMSATLIQSLFTLEGISCSFMDSRKIIHTNNQFGKAQVNTNKTNNSIQNHFNQNTSSITIVPGFIACGSEGETTTLGRGGSDYTAALLAAGTNASSLEIWTDVSGMYTAHPKLVKQAKTIEKISYEEAMEMSHFGAKVLYPPTILPVLLKQIPIYIKNTFDSDAKGTLIHSRDLTIKKSISGLSHIENISLLNLKGVGLIGIPGIAQRLFRVLAQNQINIILITQASSEHSICIAINDDDSKQAKECVGNEFSMEISRKLIRPIQVESQMAILALVGNLMKSYRGVSGRLFKTLGRNNINIWAIAQGASELNISTVIKDHDVKKAMNVLHEEFFEDRVKQLNLFVVGVGLVGSAFIEQLRAQQKYLIENQKLNIRIIALSNSKKMTFNEEGILLDNWKDELEKGMDSNLEKFQEKVIKTNLRNTVFVDNSANEKVALTYKPYLQKHIGVVTCNKIACSSDYTYYKNLHDLTKKSGASFLYETNVGASLPILSTLKNLIISGDRIHKIEAVLSGSLNFIFNNYTAKNTFASVVMQAKKIGFTEPDPSLDLSGIDVMRKILILARGSGSPMELEEIENSGILPPECEDPKTVASFFEALEEQEPFFKEMYYKAYHKKCKLNFVASFQNGKAKVGLQEIPSTHPFYNLEGKDNIVLFYTDRYKEQPLIIKGAGAGAEVTASGVFADVVKVAHI